ncbi:hypothetical protein KC19_8G169600 [Ceratodon purpureus]|uniref:Uncharacterized protein n=1 Tax=Ceratodon purpureus TaxID=3225 RepID=A0A8T0H351_CERPU|nr:hypothetical protein KC19_8G169600 [Ceratodon purpureus]
MRVLKDLVKRCLSIFYGVRSYQHGLLSVVHDISLIIGTSAILQKTMLMEASSCAGRFFRVRLDSCPSSFLSAIFSALCANILSTRVTLVNLPSEMISPTEDSRETAHTLRCSVKVYDSFNQPADYHV